MYEWKFEFTNQYKSIPDVIIQQLHHTFSDGFGLSQGWNPSEIREAFRRSRIVGMLKNANHQVEGYAFYSIPEEKLWDSYFLWEDAICIRKNVQGQGLTSPKLLLEKIQSLFPNRKFGWIGGRTQNPIVILRYAKLGLCFPIDTTYDTELGKQAMNFLINTISEVKEAQPTLDHNTGICRRIYPEGRLGDYSTTMKAGTEIERLLSLWNFHRENGDAIIISTRLDP